MSALLSTDIETQIRRRIADIDMLPTIARQALNMAKDPACSIGKFSQVVERDVKLAADILSLSNSAMYSPGTPICDLHKAILRLGFRQSKNLILTSSLKATMRRITLAEEWIREVLWRHSFTTAMICSHVNRALNIGFQGEEFTAGLVHDFGRTLFAISLPERFSEIDSFEFEESAETLEHERSTVGKDHCEVGAWFAIANQLPEPLVDAIRYHHTPESAPRNELLVALTATADHMANHIQRCGGPGGYDLTTNRAVQILEKSGIRDASDRLMEVGQQVLEASVADADEIMSR
jgi:HD-like signal output (HDOD) protein